MLSLVQFPTSFCLGDGMVSNRLQAIISTDDESVSTHISALSGLDDTNSFTLLCGNSCLSNFQCDHGTLLFFWDVWIIIANHGIERRNRASPELSTVCNLPYLVVVCYWLVLIISIWVSSVPLGQPCDCPNGSIRTDGRMDGWTATLKNMGAWGRIPPIDNLLEANQHGLYIWWVCTVSSPLLSQSPPRLTGE